MADKRQVGFSVLFGLFKRNRPYGILSLVFILFSIVSLGCMSIFWVAFKGNNGDYDFKNIEKYGVQKDAKISYVKIVYNVSINEEHPVIISYEYDDNGNSVKDKFETLDLENIAGLNVGSDIKVLVYNHQSMIKGVEPFTFPEWVFYLIPLPFFILGVIMLLIGLIPALKVYSLYKTGAIKDAVIVPADLGIGMNSLADFKRKIGVNYYFMDAHQNKVFGRDERADVLLFMNKKEGDNIKIFVSENDETKSCIVPRLEAVKYSWIIN